MYQPDKFLVLKITNSKDETHHRIFGTWSGGYLDGDSWRLNSGIVKVEAQGPFLLFHGSSGSLYKVHKDMYGASAYTGSVITSWQHDYLEGVGPKFEMLPRDTDWVNYDWGQDE
jgi:hypothetical protein